MPKNVETVRLGLAALLRGDVASALARTTPDVVAWREHPDARTYKGRAGVAQMWADWTSEFDDFEMTTGRIAEIGGRVVVEVLQRGTGRLSRAEVEGRFWFVYSFAGASVRRLDAFVSEQRAMDAVAKTS